MPHHTIKSKESLPDYVILGTVCLVLIILLYISRGFPNVQFTMAVAMCVLFNVWAYYHHNRKKDFHPRIMLEYMLISLLALIILRGAIYYR